MRTPGRIFWIAYRTSDSRSRAHTLQLFVGRPRRRRHQHRLAGSMRSSSHLGRRGAHFCKLRTQTGERRRELRWANHYTSTIVALHAPAFQLGVDLDILLQLGAQVRCRHVALIFVEVRGLWWKRRKGSGRPRREKGERSFVCSSKSGGGSGSGGGCALTSGVRAIGLVRKERLRG